MSETIQTLAEKLHEIRTVQAELNAILEDNTARQRGILEQTEAGRILLQDYDDVYAERTSINRDVKVLEEEVRAAVEDCATAMLDEGEDPYGRVFHPHIQVQQTTDIQFPDLVGAVAWLVHHEKDHLVSIKTHGQTQYFEAMKLIDALPEAIVIRKVPRAKIDSLKNWLVAETE